MHAHTVCTRPSPREACASPYAGKRGTGDEASSYDCIIKEGGANNSTVMMVQELYG